jgi:aspartyl-tRNA(Asn)/glutamyl-tRNA(Gln) amidotransferase subunit A
MPAGGALVGLPYAVKDMIASANRRPSCGLPAAPDLGTTKQASVLTLLDQAGAVRVGFTRMTALAYEPSGAGTARNPWNTAFAPGGSSSGPAAAVASGAAVVALGSDTGGSVRIPAQACGVTAWKPTWGLVPVDGTMALSPSLDTIGVLGQSAIEIASVAQVLTSGQVVQSDTSRPTIAVVVDALSACEEPVQRACRDGINQLLSAASSDRRVDALEFMREIGEQTLLVMQAEAWRTWAPVIEQGRCDPVMAKRLAKGGSIGDDQLADSLAARGEAVKAAEDRLFAGADFVVLPVMPVRTPPLVEVTPGSPEFTPRTLYALSAYTRFVNYLGFPAVALPVGFDDRGLPVGLQIVGRAGSDGDLLALAIRLQSATAWHNAIPTEINEISGKYYQR